MLEIFLELMFKFGSQELVLVLAGMALRSYVRRLSHTLSDNVVMWPSNLHADKERFS